MSSPDDPFAPPTGQPARPPAEGYGQPDVGFGTPPAGYGLSPAGYGTAPTGYAVPPGYPTPPWAGSTQTSTKAVIALVLAICSFVILPLVPSVVALVLAGSARREIAVSGGRVSGLGLVKAARIVAGVNIGLSLVAFVLLVLGVALLSGTRPYG